MKQCYVGKDQSKKSISTIMYAFKDYFNEKHKSFEWERMDSCWRKWHQEGHVFRMMGRRGKMKRFDGNRVPASS